jgi:hypothetical protein
VKAIEQALKRAKIKFGRGPDGTLVADLPKGGYIAILPAPDGDGYVVSRTEAATSEELAIGQFIDAMTLEQQAGHGARITCHAAQRGEFETGAVLRMEQGSKVMEAGLGWEDATKLAASIVATVTTRSTGRSVWGIFEAALGDRIAGLLKDAKLPS